ncbi:MAG: HAMP domain-containing protein [Cyanomargarita calcarea GSE-NOS-MK-12-04C]|jgi:signal transduction histidine kinase|uniref:histidine kinase n=1 Tax=Cyanomargarita calcarea GSE-NOS-MK-12-04C TaxID=2839659 RepID=A0A951UQF7_9CYAN|nr:HAMP domain-containing protein [Cyanomargarita calcarea GSE-NOS-MK-12-04C]
MHLSGDSDPSVSRAKGLVANLQSWLSNLSIPTKIRLGYTLTLGIALSGTITGIFIGEIYQKHSQNLIKDALEENQMLYELTTDLLEAKNLEQELVFLLDKPEKFRQRYVLFLKKAKHLEDTWGKIKSSYANPEVEETSEEIEAFEKIHHEYDTVVAVYFQESGRIYKQIENPNITPSQFINIRQQLLNLNGSDLALQVADVIKTIENTRNVIDEEVHEAEEALVTFSRIRLAIVTASIFISTILALVITSYMIKNLSRPLQTVTKIAEQVSRESNFELQVPVTTGDEVGVLAKTFNQMIARIRELLIEQQHAQENLEFYNHNLEAQVQERTEELREKNIYLQQTLSELQSTQNQIIQSEKMSSLGQLVAGVAHEINNPVSFIFGNLVHASEYTDDLLELIELYQKVYTQPEDIIQKQIKKIDLEYLKEDFRQVIDSMKVGAERIIEIVKSLRNFSRIDEAKYKEAHIHEGIDSTLMILRHRLKASGECPEIQLIKEYSQLPIVTCYPGQLNQVFMNILSNAIDAIEEYNQKRTKEEIKLNPSQIKIYTQKIDYNWVRIGIQDNAGGIPEKIISKLFDPFFTTKAVGKGTGLGLSISYQIVVEKHAGRLFCNSKLGEGTEFVIQIPIKHEHSIIVVN